MGTRRYRGSGWKRTIAAVCAWLLLAAASGCTGDPEPPDQDKPAAFALLEAFSARMLEEGAPAVLIEVKHNGQAWTHAAGVRSLETKEPAAVSDPVHVGTITESMLAVPVLKLVEEGRISLDAPVSTYLPEFGDVLHPPGPVTVRQLLSHESGMPDFTVPLLASGPWEQVTGQRLGLEQQLALAGSVPWRGRLAQVFDYSHTDYAVLALVVQRLRGKPFSEVLATDVAGPLGLATTRLDGGAAPEAMIHGYVTVNGVREDVTQRPWLAEHASAGAVSTVQELNTFYAALLQGKLLAPETVRQMQAGYQLFYGYALRRWNDTCNNRFYYGLPGDMDGYGTVAMTSEDGRKQLAMTVAYPPAPPTLETNPLILDLQDAALAALNSLCS
jgi:D-alanyl-D-alanine carboxypeptidase